MLLNKKTIITLGALSVFSAGAYAQSASGAKIDVPEISHSDVTASKPATTAEVITPAEPAAPAAVEPMAPAGTPQQPAVPAPVTNVVEIPKIAPEYIDLFFSMKSTNEVDPLLAVMSDKSLQYIDDHGNIYSGKAELRKAMVDKLAGKGEKVIYSAVTKNAMELAPGVAMISGTYKAEYDATDKTIAPADPHSWAYTAVVKFENNAWMISSFQTTKVEKMEAAKPASESAPSSGTYMGMILGVIGLFAGYMFGKLRANKSTDSAS